MTLKARVDTEHAAQVLSACIPATFYAVWYPLTNRGKVISEYDALHADDALHIFGIYRDGIETGGLACSGT